MPVTRARPQFDEPESSRTMLIIALALIPLAAMVGVSIDFGMRYVMRERLDAVAQSALASALAQSRSLRDSRYDVGIDEMEAKGRGRADLVFNAQKPNLRDIRTTFTLKNDGAASVFNARVTYVASIKTIFLRFVGLPELDVEGAAATTWVARDALINEKFDEERLEVVAAGRKAVAPPDGWMSNARTKVGGKPAVQLAVAGKYGGPPPPEGVAIALELDTPDGNIAVSRQIAVEPGAHQLRYWYRDRAANDRVAPAWLCGTREQDIDWMAPRDRSAVGDTNRMGVYLSVGPTPVPATLNATTRIDACYSSGSRWIERTVKIDILMRGDYWLTFRGEGRADATGAAIANVLFCREPCMDTGGLAPPSANYPWRQGETIFEDKFLTNAGERPLANWTVWPGGPGKASIVQGLSSGAVELDVPAGEGFENQRIGRPFLLTPGFYQLRYAYSAGPSSPHRAIACNAFGLEAAMQRVPRGPGADTRRITLIIDPDLPYLHPEHSALDVEGKPDWYSAALVRDRDIPGPKRQMLPDMANAADFCVSAPPNVTVNREITFRVDRAGYYWVTFAADGAADGEGGRVGAVQLIAHGTRFTSQGIPRILRYTERGDILTPLVGAMIQQPPGATGERALYRVQVQ